MEKTIVFNNALTIFITSAEFTYLNTKLLAGDSFVDLPRLNQTYNSGTISYIGVNQIFLDDKVKSADFKYTSSSVYAKKGDREFVFDSKKGWTDAIPNTYSTGIDFDELITSQTVVENDSVNYPS